MPPIAIADKTESESETKTGTKENGRTLDVHVDTSGMEPEKVADVFATLVEKLGRLNDMHRQEMSRQQMLPRPTLTQTSGQQEHSSW